MDTVNWDEINEIIQSNSMSAFSYRNSSWEACGKLLQQWGLTENDMLRCRKAAFIYSTQYDPYITDSGIIERRLKAQFSGLTEKSIDRIVDYWYVQMR